VQKAQQIRNSDSGTDELGLNAVNLVGGSGPTVIDGSLELEFAGVVQGNGGFLKQGAGTFRLSNANSFSSGLELREGKLEAGHAQALGSGEVNLAGGVLASPGGLSLAVANSVLVTADSKVEAPDLARLQLSGALSGSRPLEKIGPGTLALSQSSPGLAGTLKVTARTLEVAANFSAAQVDLRQGASLAGSGTAGQTTVADALLAPGASVGLIAVSGGMAIGNVVDPDTGQRFEAAYQGEINNPSGTPGADPGWDFVHVTGCLTIEDSITALSPFNVTAMPLAGFGIGPPRQWTILTADQGFRNPDGSAFQPDLTKFRLDGSRFTAFGTVTLSLSNDGRSLNVNYVPEPAQSAGMMAALLTALALGRRVGRRRPTKDR
jgi:autotransporter-associated beta strand protein